MSREARTRRPPGWLGECFAAMTRVVIRYPHAAVAAALLLAMVSVVYTATRMGYRTSRHELLDPKSDYNRHWIAYLEEFGEEDDAVVVVEGTGRDQIVPVLEEISQHLSRNDKLFRAVLHEVDLGKVRSKGLHYVPQDELQKLDGFVDQAAGVVHRGWNRLNLGNMVGGLALQMQADPAGAEPQLQRLADGLTAAFERRTTQVSPWPDMPESFATLSELNTEYLLTNQGKMGFVLLKLVRPKDSFVRGGEAIAELRSLIERVNLGHPDVKIGLTGLPVMENDEMKASESSMTWASLASFAGVALLVAAGFGGLKHATAANLVLLLGMAWSFGYLTLSVGHLNILSVSFTVTLIGIGIDYGIHYVSRYLQLRGDGMPCDTALIETSRGISPAITTGAVTTSIAFFSAAFTSFLGIAEMGIIAGGGILLCAAAELVVLPAVIYLMDRDSTMAAMPRPLPMHLGLAPFVKLPRLTLVLCLAGTAALSGGLKDLWYDHNLLNMQPTGLESVELERKLLAEANQSLWFALSIADDRDELLARKEALLKLPSVERVEEIASLLPGADPSKQPLIESIHDRLRDLPERPPVIHVNNPEELGQILGRLQAQLTQAQQLPKCAAQFEQIRRMLRQAPPADCYQVLSSFQQRTAGELLSRLHALQGLTNPEPPHVSDLPPGLVDRFVGHNGRHLLKIYGRGNIWDMEALKGFVQDVRTVDPCATGNPLQAYEASLEMKHSFELAALYSLAVVVVVLLVDFRHIGYALLAMLPLGLGVLQMFGLLGLMDIPLNPANMIALPLILGIGVDYGVHIVHDYREQTGPYRLNPSTAVAVVVDSLTTVVGFGALMLATHQGLQSLGRVLVIGITTCLLSSMIILPALLTVLRGRRLAGVSSDHDDSPPFGPSSEDSGVELLLSSPIRVDSRHGSTESKPAAESKPTSDRTFSLR